MKCEQLNRVHAYHDGELSGSARAEVESHLAVCGECRELLEELREISAMLTTVDLPEVPASAMNRMRGAWWAGQPAQERGLRQLAGVLTAIAAAVMIIMPLIPTNSPTVDPSIVATRSFEIMALVPPSGPSGDTNTELLSVAQWFATDLSTSEQSQ